MKDFRDKLAVITGGGTGMGRELARQLSAEGCHVAMCDVLSENMVESKRLCDAGAPAGVLVTTHPCDVSKEAEMIAFRDAVMAQHQTDHINLLFNNAGIGGGGSMLNDDRAEWERTFGVCWFGVYYGTRVFLPLLVASTEGCIVNTSSVNGFWACLGPETAHTAYSAAKFAVKGFTEALVVDLRLNAPHVKAAVVMPGHIGTSIIINTGKVLGKGDALEMAAAEVARIREQMVKRGFPVADVADDQIRAMMHQIGIGFRDYAPVTAAQAATTILDGVRNDEWRILVGDDAKALDRMVRESPQDAYEPSFMQALSAQGHLQTPRWNPND
jgi:NAD(P)-dependent dehydrogenase (short-subunit alcohol dehydrogenase family)